MSAWDPSPELRSLAPPGLLLDPAFDVGVAALERAGLTLDVWLYYPQLHELRALAHAHSEVQIIVDHLGGPIGIGPYRASRSTRLETWRQSISELANCPNVAIKLGGIGMPSFGMDWHQREAGPGPDELADAWAPEILWCIDRFGVDRCMFESNFPVDRISCSYTTLRNTFKLMLASFSESDKNALFHDSAARIYRL